MSMKLLNKKVQILFFSKTFSHYDSALWEIFLMDKNYNFKIFFSNNPLGIRKPKNYRSLIKLHKYKLIKNSGVWILNKYLVWQTKVIFTCLFEKTDVVIFNGEMNCFSNWIGSIICRFRKIKVIHWGHGFYGDEGFLKLFLRKSFYKLANINLVYGERARKLFKKNNFDISKVYVIYNSILKKIPQINKIPQVFKYDMFKNKSLPVILFIGRLTKQKKIDLLIDSINEINNKKNFFNLLIIGDGPERKNLQKIAKNGILKKEISFYGSEYDERILSKLISNATLGVFPGEIGLSSIHCLSYGLAIATQDNFFNQMPESEVIKEGYNGFFFKEDSKKSLKYKMMDWVTNLNKLEIKKNCLKSISNYTPENQFKIFQNILNKLVS